ncbi:30S ribosomal protein S9 [Patulibacter brassicae]|uniref:30S ribosomal protein S9 n=1 Tax=Patulibacter brassicae TaxID=1705717 RepID=UPI003872EC05
MADDVNPEETTPEADAAAEQPQAETPEAAAPEAAAEEAPEAAGEEAPEAADEEVDETPREKPAIPGADLEVDLVIEGQDERQQDEFGYYADADAEADGEGSGDDADAVDEGPIADVTIDLTAGARYTATGKRKSAVARVILTPGTGQYTIGGKGLEEYFPRHALQRTIRQALEVVGYDTQLDVVARIHGGGVSAQAGALRHGISRALIVAQPGLRGELKKRGFLTRDSRVKERKKAGLKKARKRPQFSKR